MSEQPNAIEQLTDTASPPEQARSSESAVVYNVHQNSPVDNLMSKILPEDSHCGMNEKMSVTKEVRPLKQQAPDKAPRNSEVPRLNPQQNPSVWLPKTRPVPAAPLLPYPSDWCVYFDNTPFASGESRHVFLGRYNGPPKSNGTKHRDKVVVKVFKGKYKNVSAEWCADLKAYRVAKEMATKFNKEMQKRQKIHDVIEFVEPFLGHVTSLGDNSDEYVDVSSAVANEPYLEGSFKKFNSNDGYRIEGHELIDAYSHFTFAESRGELVVCDLQGVYNTATPNYYMLTDPAVNSMSQTYGSTDMGPFGVATFLENHKCTELCEDFAKGHVPAPDKMIVAAGGSSSEFTSLFARRPNVSTRYRTMMSNDEEMFCSQNSCSTFYCREFDDKESDGQKLDEFISKFGELAGVEEYSEEEPEDESEEEPEEESDETSEYASDKAIEELIEKNWAIGDSELAEAIEPVYENKAAEAIKPVHENEAAEASEPVIENQAAEASESVYDNEAAEASEPVHENEAAEASEPVHENEAAEATSPVYDSKSK